MNYRVFSLVGWALQSLATSATILLILFISFPAPAIAQDSVEVDIESLDAGPEEEKPTISLTPPKIVKPGEVAKTVPAVVVEVEEDDIRRQGLLTGLTIFVLAVFVGFEIITKVPATLHTPLMSGSNAISGITIVGAVIAAGAGLGFGSFVGMLAVILATINAVGGFLVTDRMLRKFITR